MSEKAASTESSEELAPIEAGGKKKGGGGGGGKLLPVLLAINTLLIGAVLFFLIKRPVGAPAAPHGGEHAEEAAGEEKGEHAAAEGGEGEAKEGEGAAKHGGGSSFKPPGPILKLENFVIQLKTVDQDRYVRIAFDVEVTTEDDKTAITAHMSHIRDLVIAFFADRTLDELRGSEAMERTKAMLIKKIDEIVPGKRIKNLFITDFIVQ